MAGRAADLNRGTRGIIGAVGIESAAAAAIIAAASTAATTMLRPAAASTRAFHYCPSLAVEMSATHAHFKPSRIWFALSPLPGRDFARYQPSLRSRLSRPAQGSSPIPMEANLAERLRFFKVIFTDFTRYCIAGCSIERVSTVQFQAT